MATYWENSCSFGLRYVSWYKCLIVSLVFSHLGFWSGSLFLIAPFPDLCLLVPFYTLDLSQDWLTLPIIYENLLRFHRGIMSGNNLVLIIDKLVIRHFELKFELLRNTNKYHS